MLEEVPQLLVNGLVAGTARRVPAIGFTAIFAVLRFPNFAVASHATIGAFAGYVANVYFGVPAIAAVACAFIVAGLAGVLTDELVLRPLRPHGALTTAIASIALTLLLENLVRFGFGNDLRGYDLPIYRDWRVLDIRIGPQQLTNMALSVGCMALVFAFLAFTRIGKAMRAVADNPMLASLKGIDAVLIGRLVSLIGMGLVGIGGMLIGLDTSIDPLTGFRAILPIFAAAVLGGLGSIPGAVVGALAIGIAEELSLLVPEPYERVAVAKNFEYVIEAARAEGASPWYATAHDEFVTCMDNEVEVHLVKLDDPDSVVDPESEGAHRLEEMPDGRKMGRIVLRRGHMALLPVGSAYRFQASTPTTLMIQTIDGPVTVHKWAEICQTA